MGFQIIEISAVLDNLIPGLPRKIFEEGFLIKFRFSKKATQIDKIFTIDLTLCSKCQIDSEDFDGLCGLLRKYVL